MSLATSPSEGHPEALEASYAVVVGGVTAMEVEARLELRGGRYRLRTALRTRGVASLFGRGEQASEAEGTFHGAEPVPSGYRSEGVWRGRPRRVEIDFPPGASGPVPRALEPTEGPEEREPVPPELRRGTIDPLSVLVRLSRTVAATGRCDGAAAVFDGRRRSDAVARTAGRDLLPARPWGAEAWSGEALRCGLEWRQLAGFPRGRERDGPGRVHAGLGWIAPAWPGGPPVPVRAELPMGWFGTVRLYLLRATPVQEWAPQDQRAARPRR